MRKYINEYDIYQRIKNQIEVLIEKLITNEVLEKPWTYLTVNTKLLLVTRKDTILVVYNMLFEIAYLVTTIERVLVESLV